MKGSFRPTRKPVTFMAEKKSIKVTQISKDFNIKTKDVSDIFKEVGLDKKTGASVEVEEYELFLHKITASHQIKNIDDYIDGKTKITVASEKKEQKAEAPKAEVKPEVKPAAPKAEPVKAEQPKAAPAPKVERPAAAQQRPAAPQQAARPQQDQRRPR